MKSLMAVYPPLSFSGSLVPVMYWSSGWVYVVVGILLIFALLDVRARYKDYKVLKEKLRFAKVSSWKRIAARYKHSWCQRQVAIQAFSDMGQEWFALDYYRRLGYRWYHLLPDNTFNKNSPYFKLAFYRKLIGGT